MDEAENDPDEISYHRCLERVRDLAISACKGTMQELAASTQTAGWDDTSIAQSLEEFLFPAILYLQISFVEGRLQAIKIEDREDYDSMRETACLAMDSVPPYVTSLIPALDLNFQQDVSMGRVLKVSHDGAVCIFKSASYGIEDQLKREIHMLQQVSERWGQAGRDRLRIPRLLGLVTARNQIVGILEEYVDGENLYELNMADISTGQRRNWKMQIEKTVRRLHEKGLVWGDVKPDNIIIDRAAQAWLIDFGGSWTDGWVDEEAKETVEGDMQGLQRVVEFLGLG
jgi:serine/threonine protein kinase